MSRFYVRPEDVKGDEILVSKEEAHHIIDVMRLSAGDEVVAFDGTGKEYSGRILNASSGNLKIKIEKVIHNRRRGLNPAYIALVQALPKGAKMDFIIEKATELGADEITPLITERTIVHLNAKKQNQKSQHWQNIAISASKQCGRLSIPKIRLPMRFKDALKEARDYDLTMLACLNENSVPIKKIVSNFKGKRILVMVGPEGDFSPKEIEAAKSYGLKLISLGRLVLRVDTAAIFILSVLNYESNI